MTKKKQTASENPNTEPQQSTDTPLISQPTEDTWVITSQKFQQDKIELLVNETDAENFLNKTNKEYRESDNGAEKKVLYELPYLQTSLAINECIQLETELKQGKISVKERSSMTKDRFSSWLYLCWVSSLIEKENMKEEVIETDWTNVPMFVSSLDWKS